MSLTYVFFLRWPTGVTATTKLASTIKTRQPEVTAEQTQPLRNMLGSLQNSQTHGKTEQTHGKTNSTHGKMKSNESR